MTTLSKEDAIRAVLDGKAVQVWVGGRHSTMGSSLAGETLDKVRYIVYSTDNAQFCIKPEPKVSFIPEHWLNSFKTHAAVLSSCRDGPALRVEAYPDGTYKVERVEE